MIKLKELIELKSMIYSEEIKPKHQDKIDMKLSVFREDLQLPYSLGTSLKPDNDSPTTMRELKYLSGLKTNIDVITTPTYALLVKNLTKALTKSALIRISAS